MEPLNRMLTQLLDQGRVWIHSGMAIGLPLRGPWPLITLFLVSSLVMLWRLGAVERKGVEGTLAGTLVMPYCSGFANLAFAFVMARTHGSGTLVLENCLVNNVTNLTLILGLVSLLGKNPRESKTFEGSVDTRIGYFSLLLTLIALLFFTAAIWVLSRDKRLDRSDGMVLFGLFVFWQIIHVIEVMKTNTRKDRSLDSSVILDFIIILGCAWGSFYSIEGLVKWIAAYNSGWLSMKYLGFISGLFMVIPNALFALYYTLTGRSDIAYSSQIGDCHICIPLCIGLYALFLPIRIPGSFDTAVYLILGTGTVLFAALAGGRVPRTLGAVMALSYSVLICFGLIHLK
ncbi:MAG: sodium/calcium exchanger protein [Pseudomonadota bacterium]